MNSYLFLDQAVMTALRATQSRFPKEVLERAKIRDANPSLNQWRRKKVKRELDIKQLLRDNAPEIEWAKKHA